MHSTRSHLAVRLVGFFAMLVVGSLLYTLFNQPVEGAFATGRNMTNNTAVESHIATYGQIWDGLLFFVLLLAALMLLAAAVFESSQ